jgi:isoleucyl-tRNA synthetase
MFPTSTKHTIDNNKLCFSQNLSIIMKFHKVESSPNFFQIEEQISQYWKDNNTFEKSITTKSEDKPYRFYDGPPFITGLPHYG